MKKKRAKVPQDVADEVAFRSDLLCAICESPGHQIHHIDGNPSNNDFDNLMWLCFKHHDDATVRGKMSRKLSKGVLLRYRQGLYSKIALKRKLPRIPVFPKELDSSNEQLLFQLLLDANACIEIERLRYTLRGLDWHSIEKAIYGLNSFPAEIGVRAKTAILYVLDDISGRTRHRMPLSIACAIGNIALNVLPSRGLWAEGGPPITNGERELLTVALSIGFNLTYDGIRYLGDFNVVEQGVELLWWILTIAHINRILDIEKGALSEFDRAIETARNAGDKYSQLLLEIYKQQGLSGNHKLPDYPDELINKLV